MIFRIDLVPVPVPLCNLAFSVELLHNSVGLEHCLVEAEAHGAALVCYVPLLRQDVNYRMGCLRLALSCVRILKTADVSGKFNHSQLHAIAKPKVRDVILPCVLGAGNLSLNAP